MNKMERISGLVKNIAVSAICIGLAAGCSTTQRTTQSPRTAIEQLLISEAVLRSLPAESQGMFSIPPGAGVILNTAGISLDRALLQQILVGWLGKQGFAVQQDEKNATYRINVIVNAMGTEFGSDFLVCHPPPASLFRFPSPNWLFTKHNFRPDMLSSTWISLSCRQSNLSSQRPCSLPRPITTIIRCCFLYRLPAQISPLHHK
jgi:hypothetical protein